MADKTAESSTVATAAPETSPETTSAPITPTTAAATVETQPEILPANEPTTAKPDSPKIGLGEKIRRATRGLFDGAGFKKGKGRPKKCRACDGVGCAECNWTGVQPGKADVPISQGDDVERLPVASAPEVARVEIPITGVDSPAVDSARASLFRRSVTSAARSLLKILTSIVRVYMDAAELDAKFSDRALAKCQPDGEALNRWTDSLDAVLKKHNCEPKHSEEIALAVNTAEMLAPFGVLLAEIKGEIRRRRETEARK